MAAPLLSLQEISVNFGGRPFFQDLTLHLEKGEKTCLVGRNGSGKSTLLKVLTGIIEIDKGNRFVQSGVSLDYLAQDMDLPQRQTILEVVQKGTETFKAQDIIDRLKLNPQQKTDNLSGGEKRRVALAKTLALNPDVLLLDEPTNHLDLSAIQWLESYLQNFRGAFIVISHDRTFLENVSTSTLWLDKGCLHHHKKGFGDFDTWSEQILEEEERNIARLDTKLRQETEWLHKGVTARRKRNQGRLRHLMDLRKQKKESLNTQMGKVKSISVEGDWGSRLVIEAQGLYKSFSGQILIKNFNLRVLKGERIGIIGPNGAGKTTLLKILLKIIPADQGYVRLGKTIEPIYFDQMRETLDPKRTLWETLCPQGGDQVWVQGKSRHVFGYLKEFLFTDKQIRGAVSILSGGEKNRLSLAKSLAASGNLLVLDEPTNDLDMDTLSLLIEMLSDFAGTLLIISHDRDFLNKVTTSIIAVEGEGDITEYVGGYQDYLRQRSSTKKDLLPTSKMKVEQFSKIKSVSKKPSYSQKREWEILLPQLIETLNQEIKDLNNRLSDPNLYENYCEDIITLSQQLDQKRNALDQAETQWLELSDLMNQV